MCKIKFEQGNVALKITLAILNHTNDISEQSLDGQTTEVFDKLANKSEILLNLSTSSLAGGMPLVFTQENLLVYSYFMASSTKAAKR